MESDRYARFVFDHPFPRHLEPEDWQILMRIFGAEHAIPVTLDPQSMKLELVFDLGED